MREISKNNNRTVKERKKLVLTAVCDELVLLSSLGLHLVFMQSFCLTQSLQVGVLVEFSLVGSAGAVERLPSQLMMLLLLLGVVAVLSCSRPSQG